MLTRLHVEHETQSRQITIENIAHRDTVNVEPLMHNIVNFLQALPLYLKSGSDVSAEIEHRFLQEVEVLSQRLAESDALITNLVGDRSS
jgi:hypothetical protein